MAGAEHRRTQALPVTAPSISIEDTSTSFQELVEEVHMDTDTDTQHPTTHSGPAPSTKTTPPYSPASPSSPRPIRPRNHNPSPAPQWRSQTSSTRATFPTGRVLLINYDNCSPAPEPARSTSDTTAQPYPHHHHLHRRRRVVAQECDSVPHLEAFYNRNEEVGAAGMPALRVVHVQNAPWATEWLLRKYNVGRGAGRSRRDGGGGGSGGSGRDGGADDGMGRAFARWAGFEEPQRRAGKPVLNGKAFLGARDPWRGVRRGGFGLDYLKCYRVGGGDGEGGDGVGWDGNVKMMELNGYDEVEEPVYKYDAFVQRVSVYMQRRDGDEGVEGNGRTGNEENGVDKREVFRREGLDGGNTEYRDRVKGFDNGNAILIFEHSQSNSIEDTLVSARGEIESRWRRLLFYLKKDQIRTDDDLASECIDSILKDVLKALAISWEKYLRACETHVSILEDKIYDSPADESRAPELWSNSFLWLKVEKLMYLHIDIIKEIRAMMKEFMFDRDTGEEWLSSTPEDFDRLANTIQEDLVKPTSNLSDMMYKSVEIRDSRQSLQLGVSMWRLSWITFIFLPLTFIVGFFGMNVDTFQDNPSIKWYFISAVTLMLLVFLLWYLFKHASFSSSGLSSSHIADSPAHRGVYESLYHEFAATRPDLWSRAGPRDYVRPVGWQGRLKWRLLRRWFAPERTVRAPQPDPVNDIGVWARCKQGLVRRWLGQIALRGAGAEGLAVASGSSVLETGSEELVDLELGVVMGRGAPPTVGRLVQRTFPVAVADGGPAAARLMKGGRVGRGGGGESAVRPGTPGSPGSGVMVEEKTDDEGSNASDGEGRERRVAERGGVAGGAGARSGRSGVAVQGLGVRESSRSPRLGPVSAMDRLNVPFLPGRAGEHAP